MHDVLLGPYHVASVALGCALILMHLVVRDVLAGALPARPGRHAGRERRRGVRGRRREGQEIATCCTAGQAITVGARQMHELARMPQYVFKYVGVDSDGDLGILSRRTSSRSRRCGRRAAAALAAAAGACARRGRRRQRRARRRRPHRAGAEQRDARRARHSRAVAAPHAVAAARGRARRRRPAADVLRIRHAERPRRAHRGERLAASQSRGRRRPRRRGGARRRWRRAPRRRRRRPPLPPTATRRRRARRPQWRRRPHWRRRLPRRRAALPGCGRRALPSLPSRPPGDGNAGERARSGRELITVSPT